MTELCRLIPYLQKTNLKKRLAIWWYNISHHKRWIWQKDELLYRAARDDERDDATAAFGIAWGPNSFKEFNIGPAPGPAAYEGKKWIRDRRPND